MDGHFFLNSMIKEWVNRMTNITKKRLMDVKEAVFYLSISRATLYRLVENNDVKSILIGKRRLFDVYDLDDFIEALKN